MILTYLQKKLIKIKNEILDIGYPILDIPTRKIGSTKYEVTSEVGHKSQ
jgi:hypothetical protein